MPRSEMRVSDCLAVRRRCIGHAATENNRRMLIGYFSAWSDRTMLNAVIPFERKGDVPHYPGEFARRWPARDGSARHQAGLAACDEYHDHEAGQHQYPAGGLRVC